MPNDQELEEILEWDRGRQFEPGLRSMCGNPDCDRGWHGKPLGNAGGIFSPYCPGSHLYSDAPLE